MARRVQLLPESAILAFTSVDILDYEFSTGLF